jgi:enamine deaminase RidA (YjgF/YER057c/UK114 family)
MWPGLQATPTPTVSARELINPGDILSDASRYGDLVFTAGHLPDDASAGIDEQVESALTNLERTLQAAGAGFDTLLQVHVYLADWDDWESFNAIYVRRIRQYGLPPRTTVDIDRLGFDSLIEIEAIAHVRAAPSARP